MYCPKIVVALKEGYNKEKFFKDLISGIIVVTIALPLSIALAISVGVSPVVGIHTAIICGFLISLLGGSRVQIGGPTGAFIIIVSGVIASFGMQGLVLASIMAGTMLILMGILKLGKFIKLVPISITAGFTNGIAITIFLTQITDLLGLKINYIPAASIPKIICYIENLKTFNWGSIIVSAVSLLIMIVWPKINKKIPGSIIAIILTTLLVKFTPINVLTIGSMYPLESLTQLPKFALPAFNPQLMLDLLPSAFVIAFLAAIQSLLSAVVADQMINDEHDANAELIGQGIANIAGGFWGCLPASGAIARTTANAKNGALTPISGIVHSVTLFIILLFLMPLAQYIPLATLAAVLTMVSYNMGDWKSFKDLWKKKNKTQFIVMITTFTLTVVEDLVFAIITGIIIYLIGCAVLLIKRRIKRK